MVVVRLTSVTAPVAAPTVSIITAPGQQPGADGTASCPVKWPWSWIRQQGVSAERHAESAGERELSRAAPSL